MQHGVIGPKMYIANKDRGYGSTRLHMDVADAWNALHCGLADWLMFRRQDADALAKFFCEQGIFVGPGHPVHAQQICVTDDMLTTLEEKTGIRPYRVRQHKGDMVFIPVRCIHQVKFSSLIRSYHYPHNLQVSNLSNSIKSACNFFHINRFFRRTLLVWMDYGERMCCKLLRQCFMPTWRSPENVGY